MSRSPRGPETERERRRAKVARLLTQGLTNAQIAQRLREPYRTVCDDVKGVREEWREEGLSILATGTLMACKILVSVIGGEYANDKQTLAQKRLQADKAGDLLDRIGLIKVSGTQISRSPEDLEIEEQIRAELDALAHTVRVSPVDALTSGPEEEGETDVG